MQSTPRRKQQRSILVIGGFGFGLYLALGAVVFRIVTDPLFTPSFWGNDFSHTGSGSQAFYYLGFFDIYFLIAAIVGLSIYWYEPTRGSKALMLVLMFIPGLIVLGTLQFVYLAPFIRGILAISPILAIVHLVGRMEGETNPPSGDRPLLRRSWPWHLLGAAILIIVFEMSYRSAKLLGGLVIWSGAFVLAILLLRKVAGIHKRTATQAGETTDRNAAGKRTGEWLAFRAACAIAFIILILPLNTLVMEPQSEIESESASMSGSHVNINLVIINRYARPIDGKIQVYATLGGSPFLIAERNGLEGLGTWKIEDSHDTASGLAGTTCHLTVVQKGRQTDAKDTVIQSECVILPVILVACALSAGIREKKLRGS